MFLIVRHKFTKNLRHFVAEVSIFFNSKTKTLHFSLTAGTPELQLSRSIDCNASSIIRSITGSFLFAILSIFVLFVIHINTLNTCFYNFQIPSKTNCWFYLPSSLEPILKCEGRDGWLLMRFSFWSLHHSNFAFDFVVVPRVSRLSDSILLEI